MLNSLAASRYKIMSNTSHDMITVTECGMRILVSAREIGVDRNILFNLTIRIRVEMNNNMCVRFVPFANECVLALNPQINDQREVGTATRKTIMTNIMNTTRLEEWRYVLVKRTADSEHFYSSSLSSSSLSASSSQTKNFSAALRTLRLVEISTYFLLALAPHALAISSLIKSC